MYLTTSVSLDARKEKNGGVFFATIARDERIVDCNAKFEDGGNM